MTVFCYRQTELGEGIGSWLEPTSDTLAQFGLPVTEHRHS